MKLKILYQAQYSYAEPVTFSPHLFRLFPKSEQHVRVLSSLFQTNADAVVNHRRDLFDNEIASCFYPEKSSLLQANFNLELIVEERNAFGFLVASHALDFPFHYQPPELRVLSPYLQEARRIDLSFWKAPPRGQPTVEMLADLNSAIHQNLEYERREEGAPHPPEELLERGSGACRDFAVLLAEVLRGLGIATRLASGYLCEFGGGDKIAEGALHAWTEAYIPGAGWLGMDPTNGTFCDHHHLTAAVGLTPADISPVLGNYYSDRHIPSQMNASLQIIPHADS
jgi:transglutaminase-like putative cysteine protease